MNGIPDALTVLVPVSQYVKVEAEAAKVGLSPDSMASFLLSNWVLATHKDCRKCDGGKNAAAQDCARPARRAGGM